MNFLLTLLKYADRSKITPEAVTEMLTMAGLEIASEDAAAIANAYRTRGMPGLLAFLPQLASMYSNFSKQYISIIVECDKCHSLKRVTITRAQFKQLLQDQKNV
jgi:hypothetical protein